MTGEFDRCVADVRRSGTAINPYAVCTTAMKKRKRKKNPKGKMPPALAKYWRERRRRKNPRRARRRNPSVQHILFAQRGNEPVLKYLGGIKFARAGKPMKFATSAAAAQQGKMLAQQFPVLRSYRIWAS